MECTGLVPHPETWQQSDTMSGVPVPCSGDNRRPFSGQPEAGHGVCLFPAEGSRENTLFSRWRATTPQKCYLRTFQSVQGTGAFFCDPQFLLPCHVGPVACGSLSVSLWLVSISHYALILLQACQSCTAPACSCEGKFPERGPTCKPELLSARLTLGRLQFWS